MEGGRGGGELKVWGESIMDCGVDGDGGVWRVCVEGVEGGGGGVWGRDMDM